MKIIKTEQAEEENGFLKRFSSRKKEFYQRVMVRRRETGALFCCRGKDREA